MALVKEDAVQRVEVHDGWIDVKAAATVGLLMDIGGNDYLSVLSNPTGGILHRMLCAFIVGWSYDDPVTPENIKLLDMDATTSVMAFVQEGVGVDQKKGQSNGRRSRGAAIPQA